MQPKDLLAVWNSPDNSRLTSKQFSFRLPVHVAAKIAALCEMYPTKSRTQIVGDLLSAALQGMEAEFPQVKGKFFTYDEEQGVDLYVDIGPASQYRELVNKHFKELETELGTEKPSDFYSHGLLVEVPRQS